MRWDPSPYTHTHTHTIMTKTRSRTNQSVSPLSLLSQSPNFPHANPHMHHQDRYPVNNGKITVRRQTLLRNTITTAVHTHTLCINNHVIMVSAWGSGVKGGNHPNHIAIIRIQRDWSPSYPTTTFHRHPPPHPPSHDMSMMAVDRQAHSWHPGPPHGPHPHRPLVKLGPQLLLEDDGQQREDGEEGHPGDVAVGHHGVLVGRERVYRLTRLNHDGRRRCDAWQQKKGGRTWGDKAKCKTTPPNDTNQHNR